MLLKLACVKNYFFLTCLNLGNQRHELIFIYLFVAIFQILQIRHGFFKQLLKLRVAVLILSLLMVSQFLSCFSERVCSVALLCQWLIGEYAAKHIAILLVSIDGFLFDESLTVPFIKSDLNNTCLLEVD